ncbi:MAG: hypothetical protein M1819_006737 [Sarea resinae]|nr:MAG: hypothetical protein M1819_006737 [Sarea resinae]
MPSFLSDDLGFSDAAGAPDGYDRSARSSPDKRSMQARDSTERRRNTLTSNGANGYKQPDGIFTNGVNSSIDSLPNGGLGTSNYNPSKDRLAPGSPYSSISSRGRPADDSTRSPRNSVSNGTVKQDGQNGSYFSTMTNGATTQSTPPLSPELRATTDGSASSTTQPKTSSSPRSSFTGTVTSTGTNLARTPTHDPANLHPASSPPNRYSSPAKFNAPHPSSNLSLIPSPQHPGAAQLQQRHTLQVPKITPPRNSRDSSTSNPIHPDDLSSASGRFSPTVVSGTRRASMSLSRRMTRSIHSDMRLEDIPQDDDAARWADAIRAKRASKRKKKEEEDEDRVVVGTKVDQNHVNWVTAYNMLTGIRFTVSRTNAKMDRELTDADFDAKHKFSFDITGNELTPSAKYDFKFKDYAPWVFRHLRAKFKLDPADYLMSLTSKYILSELGSPGKSGSFFYFSRDYKYIIKTIHHAEHKFLRKILRDYYQHVQDNPNTLLSQFYGLHRVKIPYGRKLHFVVMNNLFPAHRDIHQTFDLKGSTIGRDFKEEDLEKNPRATLKDLNWLRRDLHLEFGPTKKQAFVTQMERDVKLLQRLKIMDYSLLVGIHDLTKGNEENLRDKTLQIFQPGGDRLEEPQQNMLLRTPSKLENARKARELRQIIKREKPVPMDQSSSKMPDEMLEERKYFYFYSDDGGFRATHEDDRPGQEIYYLGIIDCLTNYGVVKKSEHFLKGLSHNKSQISPIPPEGYGDRFIKFITGITKTKEEAEREKLGLNQPDGSLDIARHSDQGYQRTSIEQVMAKAEKMAEKSKRHGPPEEDRLDRTLVAVRSPSLERTNGATGSVLPIVEEAGEGGSSGSRSQNGSTVNEQGDGNTSGRGNSLIIDNPHVFSDKVGSKPPPTPPKDATGHDKEVPYPPRSSSLYGPPSPVEPTGPEDMKSKMARAFA